MIRRRRLSGDAGVTMVELLMTIAISGVILGAVSVSLLFALRTQGPTAGQLNNSRSEQLMAVWLPADLASVDAVGGAVTAEATVAGCEAAPVVPGKNVVRLRVTDESVVVPTVTYISYRVVASGSLWRLTRTSCLAGGVASTRVLLDGLPSSGSVRVVPTMTAASLISNVTMTVATLNNRQAATFSLQGNPRSTAVTVPAQVAASPALGAAPGFGPCIPTLPGPAGVTKVAGVSTALTKSFTFTVTLNLAGTCVIPSFVFAPGAAGEVTLVLSTGTGAIRTAVVTATTYAWTTGTKAVKIMNNGVQIGMFSLVVT